MIPRSISAIRGTTDLGVGIDHAEALRRYLEAASQGDASAMISIAALYRAANLARSWRYQIESFALAS
jgi:TPR repeat protein